MNGYPLEKFLHNPDSVPNQPIGKYQDLGRSLAQFFEARNHPHPEQLARSTLNRVSEILKNQGIGWVEDSIWVEAAAISRESRSLETLLQCLDPDRDCAGKKYVAIKSRLVQFFQRNDCPAAEDLSDRTLDRVSKILQRRKIDEVMSFIVGVGRKVLRESWKRPAMARLNCEIYRLCCPSHELTLDSRSQYASLMRCIERLEPRDRELFREYFMSLDGNVSRKELAEHRERVAQRFGLTLGALRVKAHRLRSEVRRCCLRRVLLDRMVPPPKRENTAPRKSIAQ